MNPGATIDKIVNWLGTYAEKIFLSLLVLLGLFIILLIIKLVSIKIKKKVNEKAQKITSIINTIVKYMLIIFSIFIILAVWDFDTTIGVIIFSVVVLIFGLSAIPFIQDIYFGIANVFSSNYKIGDYVKINNYYGKVINFTLVKTQIQGSNGEIKTFMNNTIKEIENYSIDYLTVSVVIKISELKRVDEIKKIIEETLPQLHEEYREIEEGPNLIGFESFVDGVASLKIEAKVKVINYNKVMKGLQEYLYNITVKYNIK